MKLALIGGGGVRAPEFVRGAGFRCCDGLTGAEANLPRSGTLSDNRSPVRRNRSLGGFAIRFAPNDFVGRGTARRECYRDDYSCGQLARARD
jgi:hypothetical protein